MDEEQIYKRLKPLVNNFDMWQNLDNLLDLWYNRKHREMENLEGIERIYRAQGYIKALHDLKTLREIVNAK